jgi:D-lactate dehydrogenase (cytochrome)
MMDKVLEVSEADGDAIVQAGVKWEDLNAYLASKGV